MDWLLQKAIESGLNNETAEILNSHADAIKMLDEKLSLAFWILLSIVIGLQVLNLFMFCRLDKRLKKLEQ